MEFPRMCPARWISDPNFGMCIPPHDFMSSCPFFDMHSNYYRPWKWHNHSISKEFSSTIENERGNYKITLDVKHFRSNEINVKVADNEIIVEGKHEERPDTHGFVTRQFRRRYPLPSHCPPENVTSMLSSDGVLTIIAERKSSSAVEKIVPIKMCGTYPGKTQFETKITSIKTHKENLKETEDSLGNRSQIIMKEDHCRLLKPGLLKETNLETNGTCTEKATVQESTDNMRVSEKLDTLNIGSRSNKIEESIEKSILGLTALTEQLGHSSLASTSGSIKTASEVCEIKGAEICDLQGVTEMSAMKSSSGTSGIKGESEISAIKDGSEISGMKGLSEINTMKYTSETSGTKGGSDISNMKPTSHIKTSSEASGMRGASESGMKELSEISSMKYTSETSGVKGVSDISGMKGTSETSTMKSASELSGMKGIPEASGMKSASEISAIKSSSETRSTKGTSKTLIEESRSSYKSSSSMSSSTRISGKAGDINDIISAELREAAENV